MNEESYKDLVASLATSCSRTSLFSLCSAKSFLISASLFFLRFSLSSFLALARFFSLSSSAAFRFCFLSFHCLTISFFFSSSTFFGSSSQMVCGFLGGSTSSTRRGVISLVANRMDSLRSRHSRTAAF